MFRTANRLENRGQKQEALRWWVQAAKAGRPEATERLPDLLQSHEELFTWWQRAVEIGDLNMMTRLARRLESTSQAEKANAWLQSAADSGNMCALWWLADQREAQGQVEEAFAMRRQMAERGMPAAMDALASHYENSGQLDGALSWRQRSLELGFDHDGRKLVTLLREMNRESEFQQITRFGIEPGKLTSRPMGPAFAARIHLRQTAASSIADSRPVRAWSSPDDSCTWYARR